MIQGPLTPPGHPPPQLGKFEAQFARSCLFLNKPPLMMSPINSSLDNHGPRRLPGPQPRPSHSKPSLTTPHRIPRQHRQIGPHFGPVQRFF